MKEAYDFKNGWAVYKISTEQYGYIKQDENGFINPNVFGSYKFATSFENGFALVKSGNSIYMLDKNLTEVATKPLADYYTIFPISNGMIKLLDRLRAEYSFIDINLNPVIPPVYKNAKVFNDDMALVEFNGEVIGFTDKSGKTIAFSTRQYVKIKDFSEGLAPIKNTKSLWGFIDKNGKEVIPCQFEDVDSFHEGLAGVLDKDRRLYFIDKKGKVKIDMPKLYCSTLTLDDKVIYIHADSEQELNEKKLIVLSHARKEAMEKINSNLDEIGIDIASEMYESSKIKTKTR